MNDEKEQYDLEQHNYEAEQEQYISRDWEYERYLRRAYNSYFGLPDSDKRDIPLGE